MSNVPYTVCAKTGTTMLSDYGNLDAWNAGFSKDYTLCVWYGDIDYSDEHAVTCTGGGLPTILASHIFRSLSTPVDPQFIAPEGIFELKVDGYGLEKDRQIYLANEFSPKKYLIAAYFSENNRPIDASPYFSRDILNSEMEIDYMNGTLHIEFDGNPEFSYKINIKDASSDETFIGSVSENEGVCTYSGDIQRFNIYFVALEIWFEGEKLAVTPPRILIT
jgi:hypothetical protein